MIDERFSVKKFVKCGWKTKESRVIANELTQEIQKELHKVLKPAFEDIIQKLNALGHNLKLYEEDEPANYHYREYSSEDSENYKTLVALDTVVTVGYPETTDALIIIDDDDDDDDG